MSGFYSGSGNLFRLEMFDDEGVPAWGGGDAGVVPGGVEVDGVVYVDGVRSLEGAKARMRHWNRDGSAAMCGNAARVVASVLRGAGYQGDEFESPAGPVSIGPVHTVTGTPTITWTVPPSEGEYVTSSVLEALHTSTGYQWQYANTGTHHLVTFLPTEDALAAADIDTPGLDVVRQSVCNANFVVITSPTSMTIRTFEKGVDAETGACGTGAAAACFLAQRAHLLPPGDPSDTSKCISVTTHAGTLLVQTTPAVGTDGGIRVTLGGTVDEIR